MSLRTNHLAPLQKVYRENRDGAFWRHTGNLPPVSGNLPPVAGDLSPAADDLPPAAGDLPGPSDQLPPSRRAAWPRSRKPSPAAVDLPRLRDKLQAGRGKSSRPAVIASRERVISSLCATNLSRIPCLHLDQP
jgi:hypothetical protein